MNTEKRSAIKSAANKEAKTKGGDVKQLELEHLMNDSAEFAEMYRE